MWLLLSLFILCRLARAGDEYGVPPPPPLAPYPLPAPQYPSVNPGYPPHHGRHHHRSQSNSYSRSDSDEECDDCEDLRAHCRGGNDGQCVRPKFRYVHSEHHDRPGHHKRQPPHKPRKQCRQVVITCPRDGQYSLETSNYHQFFNGQGFSVLAKCSRRGKWEARDLSGNKASFTRIRCVPQGTPGYPSAPVYPPVTQPDYQPVPAPAYPDQPASPPPVYPQ